MPDDKKEERTSDLEGEGSYSADRKYREDVKKFTDENDVDKLARDARRDVEADEPTYRKAEEEGKRRIAEEDPEDKKII
ncbi:MAG TPA: hypothetical protein VFF06_20735 [Polyangia bacterium]|nr:hypothetical protein [Polyangia bacterium]